MVVSALGANAASKNFYLRVKGEMEKALEGLRFRALDIMEPSLLLGARRELRVLELSAQLAMQLVTLEQLTALAVLEPIWTVVAPGVVENPVPVMVRWVPPAVVPEVGDMLVTVGAGGGGAT